MLDEYDAKTEDIHEYNWPEPRLTDEVENRGTPARELLPGLRSGRSTIGRGTSDRPVNAKPRARERPGLFVLSQVFARVYGWGRTRPGGRRAPSQAGRTPARRLVRRFGPRALGFSC